METEEIKKELMEQIKLCDENRGHKLTVIVINNKDVFNIINGLFTDSISNSDESEKGTYSVWGYNVKFLLWEGYSWTMNPNKDSPPKYIYALYNLEQMVWCQQKISEH